ncbi:MAG TPA: hemerythrin domain-containing protein [Pseudomonadales bacterium]|nr:hemerythrin domain-containing protein [Pseudomonadales bacterium]
MSPIDLLIQEHLLIERLLKLADSLFERLLEGRAVRRDVFQEIYRFFDVFADGYHHQKEERELFPLLVECGLAADKGPIAVMMLEHCEARSLTEQFGRAADRYARGDTVSIHALVYLGQTYIDLLLRHIAKENNVLFNLAKRFLDEDDDILLNRAFQRINLNVINVHPYESFTHLVNRLEAEFMIKNNFRLHNR